MRISPQQPPLYPNKPTTGTFIRYFNPVAGRELTATGQDAEILQNLQASQGEAKWTRRNWSRSHNNFVKSYHDFIRRHGEYELAKRTRLERIKNRLRQNLAGWQRSSQTRP